MLFPELEQMNFIFQDKKRNQSLFDHSVKVLEYTYSQTQYKATLMAAFFHDYGKIFTYKDKFAKHDAIGIKEVIPFFNKHKIDKDIIGEIKLIMSYHVNASQYQRDPNWTDEAVKRFIKRTHPLTLEVIKVARADKRSSHDYAPYLLPYKELEDRIISIFQYGIEI